MSGSMTGGAADDQSLYLNGVSSVTGQYLVPPLGYEQAAALIKGVPEDRGVVQWLRAVWRTISQPHLGLPLDIDPADVRQAGWAVVFDADEADIVKQALAPLIE